MRVTWYYTDVFLAGDCVLIMADAKNSAKNTCFAHSFGVSGVIKPFTIKRWSTFLKSVDKWKDLVGYQADIARAFVRDHGGDISTLPVPEVGGCHETCYKYFTDSTKQKRGETNKEKELLAESVSKQGKT